MTSSSLLAHLRAAFLEDLEEQLAAVSADLLALERDPEQGEPLRSLFRAFHTIKGAARAADLKPVERLCHDLEARLAAAREGEALGAGDFRLLFAALDALRSAGSALHAQGAISAEVEGKMERIRRGEVTPAAGRLPDAAPERVDERVRVGTDRLDRLVSAVGQLRLAQSRSDDQWTALLALLQARATATGSDRELAVAVREADRARRHSARLLSELEHQAHDLRLRPFADAVQALPRVVRDVAAGAGKQIELRIRGEEVEADRAVVEALREALLHLIRNAADHGLEPPEERADRGKPRQGRITIVATLAGDRVEVTVADDGRGLDLEALRSRLASRGLPVPDDDDALARRLLEGGLSSQQTATAISGRGVGLDAARRALEAVHGTLRVSWQPGRGTTFTLLCPVTFATVRALLCDVGSERFALPNHFVEGVRQLSPSQLHHAAGLAFCPTPEGPVPVVPLARVLGLPAPPPLERLSLVQLRAGERRLAVAVDALLSERELTIRPVSTAAQELPLVSGGVLLPSGQVLVVLNPAAVLDAGLALHPSVSPPPAAARAAATRPRVLVVDDSVTTRTLERSTLEAAGYEVLTAVDGAEGWRLLQEQGADLVVTDVEMPVMDGLELCAAIRGSQRFGELPVILVTSLESPEHRARGLEVGADAYLGKSGFDQQGLLSLVRQLLAVDPP